jgi:hypothetical protein
VAGCPRCAGFLREAEVALPRPGWLAGVERAADAGHPAAAPRWRPTLPKWAWPALPAAAALGAVLLVALVRQHDDRSTDQRARELATRTTTKGTPAVAVYVKRGSDVFLWDGRARIRPQDRLRLQIRAEGYTHVSVASLASPNEVAVVLYEGPLAEGAVLLPLSFRVDDRSGPEVVSVVLARAPVAGSLHRRLEGPAGAAEESANVWRQILVLEKDDGRQR